MSLKDKIINFSKKFKKAEIQTQEAQEKRQPLYSLADYYQIGRMLITKLETMMKNIERVFSEDESEIENAWRMLEETGCDSTETNRVVKLVIANRAVQRRDLKVFEENFEEFKVLRENFMQDYGSFTADATPKEFESSDNHTYKNFDHIFPIIFYDTRYSELHEKFYSLKAHQQTGKGIESEIVYRASKIPALQFKLHTIARGFDYEPKSPRRMICKDFMGKMRIDFKDITSDYLTAPITPQATERTIEKQ